jgi:O-methyltransferase
LSRWRRRRRKRRLDADVAALDALDPVDRAIIEQSLPHTMTGIARLQSVIDAVRYCERRGIPGAFAECGVWRGGSVLAMILTLQDLGSRDRDIYLLDTFEGMTEPGERDVSRFDGRALEKWRDQGSWTDAFQPEVFNEQDVRQTLAATSYPATRLMFVKGRVEETIPAHAPERIALLRLDTDWYESTRHELVHLYPRLCSGGVLIVDDYGHWDGCRQAVDEYFSAEAQPVLLSRIDYTARLAIKA